MRLIFSLAFIYLVFLSSTVSAEVFINEFKSSGSDDWVEIYNDSEESKEMTGFFLVDGSTSGNKKEISCTFAPKSFLVIEWGNKLNNKGDVIFLKKDTQTLDCITYGDFSTSECSKKLGSLDDGDFAARIKDGIGDWAITVKQTKGASNDGSGGSSSGCTRATNTPLPTPTFTPQPDRIATVTPTPRATIKVLSDSDPDQKNNRYIKETTVQPEVEKEEETLSKTDVKLDISPEVSAHTKKQDIKDASRKKTPIYAFLFILGGVSFLGSGGYLFWHKKQEHD